MVARLHVILSLAAFGAVLAPAPLLAATTELQPNGPWNVHFADEKCVLSGVFGDERNAHLLAFQQYWPSGSAGVTVAGPAFGKFENLQPTRLTFYDGQQAIEGTPFRGKIEDVGAAVIYTSVALAAREQGQRQRARVLPDLDTAFGQQVRYVSVKQGSREVRLQTGPLKAAFEVLNSCTEGLITEWGLDLERHRTATALPKWRNSQTLVRRLQGLYPSRALNAGESGIMWLRVIVGEGGKVEDCVIHRGTKSERLDSPACNVMQTAEFEPARDAGGQPFRSYYATMVTYRINP